MPLRLNAGDFASRSKVKAKPQGRNSASSSTRTTRTTPTGGKNLYWQVEPQEYSPSDYSVSKKLINLLRHGSLPRDNDGAIEFWRIKIIFRVILCFVINGLTKSGRAAWQEEEDTRTVFSIVLILQEKICTSELFKVIQDAILLSPSLQDNVLIPDDFFKYIYHVGCVINLHSIINSGLIPGRSKIWANDRQYSFCLWIPWSEKHKDTDTIDSGSTASCTVHAYSVEETSKHGVSGWHQTCSKERIKVLSDSIERHHPLQYTPSLLYPESCSDGNWRN